MTTYVLETDLERFDELMRFVRKQRDFLDIKLSDRSLGLVSVGYAGDYEDIKAIVSQAAFEIDVFESISYDLID